MFFLFDLRVNAVLGGTSMRVINTAFRYYLTWHGEKSRGTEFKPCVEVFNEVGVDPFVCFFEIILVTAPLSFSVYRCLGIVHPYHIFFFLLH